MAMLRTLCCLLALCSLSAALPEVLRVGGLFESGDDVLELAFRYAVDKINADSQILPHSRLSAQVERLERYDSFQASKKVCSLLHDGIASVFGPQSVEASAHVQSTCDVLEIPHIETRWEYRGYSTNHSVNLYPDPIALGKAYLDLLRFKNWKSFAILYEENEALIRIQEILKDPFVRNKRVIVRQIPPGQEYRKVLKELGKAGYKNIILDVSREHIPIVLKHAQQVDMMSEYHNYFVTSLDLHTIDLEDFQYGGTNVTGYSLVGLNTKEFQEITKDWTAGSFRYGWRGEHDENVVKNITTEVALMYDAVRLFATALNDLDRSQAINVKSISCDSEDPWLHGKSLINYMKMINIKGLTGDVKFDQYGHRTDFKLRLLELTHEGLREAGDWSQHTGINITANFSKAYGEALQSLMNKTLIVTTIINPPYTMWAENADQLTGNDRFEGYSVDLMKEIAKTLKFKYKFKVVDDQGYGRKNDQGEWNGMIRELMDGKADIAVADLTITYEREEVVDFTMPFMNLGIGILFKKPQKKVPKLFSFLSPLSVEVWLCMVTAFMGVSLFLFVVARFSPYEWTNPHPCDPNPEELENQFSMLNTLWFTIGCLMCQGCDYMPRALSTRVVAGTWWFFTLILVSSYTANLAAFLTVERMVSPIENAEDLSKQTKIQYGCVASGSTQAFFKDSKIDIYQRMWTYMESARPSVFSESNAKGVERVLKGNYAFLMESTTIEYIVERNCELTQVGGLLDSKGYGIATPSGSPYRTPLSSAILSLQEGGVLHLLKERWWRQRKGGGQCAKEDTRSSSGSASELGLANVGGVFLVLFGGSVFACIVALVEFIWKTKKIARDQRDSLCTELMKELKFAITCGGSSKPVRKPREEVQVENGLPFMPLTGFNTPDTKEAFS